LGGELAIVERDEDDLAAVDAAVSLTIFQKTWWAWPITP